MDVGILMIRNLDDICWSALEDPSTPYEVAGMAQQMGSYFGMIMNSFIGARKLCPFIYRCKPWIQ